ncbi:MULTISPECIES: 50S ribosomal protein L22 [Prochlorococcus]|uniref:50S ribosomal protein L22 n=1 Tax=Prochlorococcus TaxID=1218 RepID=UPI0007B3E407|nr:MULTISPECIES: 50S ribosomal protein L22 [Prochlorococcus]KZR63622.1 50S ribosomal protein L22 [Prochlorococcus marinus str. MIT 1312]KZR78776.1 50S ribosomal protein L22 [Prochlorococcus marinus str. MIT 1327]NMO84453.1 50S ribosomal protein L22 [Prochlorococcus sp. P1344]NMP06239.1 50S ribosomal protein L22 [Prochlorococcus sp. P1361]NMP14124.1 50S ribosomal protein L22 [Prochlorococcus sp.P1363]
MTTSSPTTTAIAKAHGRFIRGSVSKVRRVLDQIRGRTYRDALIMLEFMPYRSTGPITKVLRSAVANAEHNLGLDPASLVIAQASADMGPSMKRYRPRAQGRAFAIKKQTCHISIAVAAQTDS